LPAAAGGAAGEHERSAGEGGIRAIRRSLRVLGGALWAPTAALVYGRVFAARQSQQAGSRLSRWWSAVNASIALCSVQKGDAYVTLSFFLSEAYVTLLTFTF
jgi:hypothetical protein